MTLWSLYVFQLGNSFLDEEELLLVVREELEDRPGEELQVVPAA